MTDAEPPPRASESGGWRRPAFLALLIVALAAGLWVPCARSLAVWTDELYSLRTAEEPPLEMIRNLRHYLPYFYDHPPLYFLILRSVLVCSEAPLAIRLYSMIFGALAVWIVVAGPQRRGSAVIAAAAAVALVFHPMIRYHSIQARMYALDLMLASAATALLILLPAAPPKRAWRMGALLGLVLAAAVYTSYHAAFFAAGVGALGIAWAAWPRLAGAETRRPGAMVLVGCAIAVVLLLPWLPVFLTIPSMEEGVGFSSGIPRPRQAWDALVSLAGTKAGLAALLVGWIGLAAFARDRLRAGSILACAAIFPFAVLGITTPETRIFSERYVIYAIPPMFEAALAGFEAIAERAGRISERRRRFAIGGAALMLLAVIPFSVARARLTFLSPAPDWWGAARIIEENCKPGEKILTGGYLSGEAMVYHTRQPERFEFIHNQTAMDPFYLWCKNPGVVWYVNCAPLPRSFADIVRHYFPYSSIFPGNRDRHIMVYCKRPFRIPWGGEPQFAEPKPLQFEEEPRRRAEAQGAGTPSGQR